MGHLGPQGLHPSQLPVRPVCGPCSFCLRSLQLCLRYLVLSSAPCRLPPARSAPLPPTLIHSPPHYLPHGAHLFLHRSSIFCLQALAQVVPSTGTHTFLLYLEDARHDPAPCFSCSDTFQATAGRVRGSLLGAHRPRPWVSCSLGSTVPTTLGCDWFPCLFTSPTPDWEQPGGRGQLSPALWSQYTAQGLVPRRDPK